MLSAHLTSSIIAIDIAVRMTAFLTLNDFAFKMLRDASVIIGPGRGGAPIVTTTTPPAASSTASTLTATRNTRRGGSVLHSSVGTAGSGGSDRDVEDEEKEEKDGAYLHDASWWLNHVHDSCGSSSQSKKKRQKLAGAPKLSTSTRTSSEGPRGPAGGSRGNAGAMRGGSRAGDGEGKTARDLAEEEARAARGEDAGRKGEGGGRGPSREDEYLEISEDIRAAIKEATSVDARDAALDASSAAFKGKKGKGSVPVPEDMGEGDYKEID